MRFAVALALAGAVAASAAAFARGTAPGIPRGFHLETAAAVGKRDLWVLGEYRCGAGWCLALARSTDSGKQFRRVALPALPSQGTDATLVFANRRDGFVYVEDGTPLYVTRDGGESWHREGPARNVSAFAAAGGYAYLVAGNHGFFRSPVGRDAWQRVAIPVQRFHFSLAARGADVWVLGGPRHQPDFDTVRLSTDHGRTFTARKGPCLAELGGGLVPAAQGVVWAICPTGNFAGLELSRDDGRSFPATRSAHDPGGLRDPSLVNSAQIAAASAHVAVLDRGADGALLRTTDTGRHWRVVPHTARIQGVFWLSFTTPRIGGAVVQTGHGTQLWRTTDVGATWHSVPIR